MKLSLLFFLLIMPWMLQAGERLKGISDSMDDAYFSFDWFSKNKEKKVKQPQTVNQVQQKANTETIPQDSSQDCVRQKVYSLDVANPEQYKRLEDYPYTYECISPHK